MNQLQKAKHFADLHEKYNPLVLFNIWDAGGAQAVEKAGAKAVASGSYSVAAAHGYSDGEQIPLELVEIIVSRICSATELPVTIDFEGGYSEDPDEIALNVQRIIRAGAVAINFEDQIVGAKGIHPVSTQVQRINAVRESATQLGLPVFINARTDLFLQADSQTEHAALLDEVKERADAYEKSGASGIFLPGLIDENLISHVCEYTNLPVNVMMMEGAPPVCRLARAGVSRVSFGPAPYFESINTLSEQARKVFGSSA